MKLLNLANGLTLFRFVAAPVMLWLVLAMSSPSTAHFSPWISLATLILIGITMLTDLLDGMVARAYKTVTDFGKIMDPVADSTFFMTLMFAFSASERFAVPVWIPILILYREVIMQVLRRYAALNGIVLAAKLSGKIKMATQCILMTGVLAATAFSDLGVHRIGEATLVLLTYYASLTVAIVNILSLAEYLQEVPELVHEWRERD